jgi:hypothetical protein
MRKKRKKRPNKGTKARESWELRNLKRKVLRAWSIKVRNRAGNKCELSFLLDCGDGSLSAHHLEDYRLCPAVRYDPECGVCTCPKHHKFSKNAVHKSFTTVYEYMTKNRPEDIEYLKIHRHDEIEWAPEVLLKKLKELQNGKNA